MSDTVTGSNGFVLDPLSPQFQEDRHVIFKNLRENEPVSGSMVEVPSGRQFTNWNATSYDDVLFILKDPRFVKEMRNAVPSEQLSPIPEAIRELVKSQRNQMLFRDPPDHTRLRRLVNKAFTPKIVERLTPSIHDIAYQLLSPIETGATFDVIKQFAFPLPVIVIADLLGVPKEDRDLFKNWSSTFVKTIDYNIEMEDLIKGNQVVIEFRDYFREIVKERTLHPQHDLISELILARDEKGSLSEDELLDMCILILVAGHETTVNLITNSIYLLLKHDDQLALLRQQPELISSAIEEVLRFESPVQVTSRNLAENLELNGKLLKKGDVINAWIASANRDSAKFNEPDKFMITRSPNPHLAFGQGNHYCLGAPLARQEGIIAVETFLEKFPEVTLAREVEWSHSPLMRSLKSLLVRV